MNIKIRVQTPEGHAESVESQLRLFLIGKLKQPANTWISPEKNEFYWDAEVTVKKYFNLSRNVNLFQQLAGGTLDQINKRAWIKKLAKINNTTIEGARKLIEETTVEIIKNATAEEITEANTTMWEKIKKTYKKVVS